MAPIIRTCSAALAALLFAGSACADPAAYVRARAADAAGAAQVAAAGYAEALAAAPDDAVVAMRAYRQALAAGDYSLASRAGAVLVRAGVAPPDTALLALAIAIRSGDRGGAQRAVDRLGTGPFDFLAPSLRAWLAFDRGEDGVAVLDAAPGNALARRYSQQSRVLLLIAARRTNEAMAALASDLTGDDGGRKDAAALLGATGARDQARRLLVGEGPEYAALRKRLGKGLKPGAAFGASRLFLALATEIAAEDMQPLSVLLARAALLLDPADDRGRLELAEALSRGGSHDLALATLDAIGKASPYARDAAAGRVAALRRAGREAEALALAQSLSRDKHASAADAQTYGEALDDAGRFADAAAAYAAAIARSGEGWSLNYLRGRALDRAGKWSEALPVLQRAVALGPDQAAPLEYLGYAQIARGENMAEGQALLERASRLEPNDAGIADSLAWAWYQRGEVSKALPLLERAVRRAPAAARANEHLGDAYWRLGRHYEARYAWRAAAVTAGNDAGARLAAKLADGLPALSN